MRICELLETIPGAVYVERVSLHNPAGVRAAKKAIHRAFEVQEKGLGYEFIVGGESGQKLWRTGIV